MDALSEVRKKGSPSRFLYFLWLAVALVQTGAAMIGAYGSSGSIGVFMLCAVPFFVVTAYSVDQARINHALLREIDELRSLLSVEQRASLQFGPNSSLKRTDQSLRD
jgi:hypothetical protein